MKQSDRFKTDYDDGSLVLIKIDLPELINFKGMCEHKKTTQKQINQISTLIKSKQIYLQILTEEKDDGTNNLTDEYGSVYIACDEKNGEKIGSILNLRFDDGSNTDKYPEKGITYYYFESE